jgi:hypothetical protein
MNGFLFLAVVCFQFIRLGVDAEDVKKPEYQKLPDLGEQAELKDSWTKERIENIPNLLEKYGVDAWLVRLPLSSSPSFLFS